VFENLLVSGGAVQIIIIILLIVIIAILAPALVIFALVFLGRMLSGLWEVVSLLILAALVTLIGLAVITAVRSLFKRKEARAHPLPGGINPHYNGPGIYRVYGVDRETGVEITCDCDAQDRLDAKRHAEIEGIQVTEVRPTKPAGM
jgi:hypothetical protein